MYECYKPWCPKQPECWMPWPHGLWCQLHPRLAVAQPGGQLRAPGQGHTESTGVLAQPLLGTGNLMEPGVKGTPGLGPEGKEFLSWEEVWYRSRTILFPFGLTLCADAFAQLEMMHPGVMTVVGLTASLRRESEEKVGHSTLFLHASRDCFEPLKCACLGQVTHVLKK